MKKLILIIFLLVVSLFILNTSSQNYSIAEKKFTIGCSTDMPGYVIKLFGHCYRAKIIYDKAIRFYRGDMNRYPSPLNNKDSIGRAQRTDNIDESQPDFENVEDISCKESSICINISKCKADIPEHGIYSKIDFLNIVEGIHD